MDGWDQLENFFTDFPNFLFTMIMQLLYFLVSCCYTLLDLAQLMFRLIAGLDTYALAGETVAGDAKIEEKLLLLVMIHIQLLLSLFGV